MWLRMARHPGVRFVARDDVGVQFRIHPSQESSRLLPFQEECLTIEFLRVLFHRSTVNRRRTVRRLLNALGRDAGF